MGETLPSDGPVGRTPAELRESPISVTNTTVTGVTDGISTRESSRMEVPVLEEAGLTRGNQAELNTYFEKQRSAVRGLDEVLDDPG